MRVVLVPVGVDVVLAAGVRLMTAILIGGVRGPVALIVMKTVVEIMVAVGVSVVPLLPVMSMPGAVGVLVRLLAEEEHNQEPTLVVRDNPKPAIYRRVW